MQAESRAVTSTGTARYWPALDVVGTFLSALCAVHCVATPFVVAFLPFLGGLHSRLPPILAVVALVAVGGGALVHRDTPPLVPLGPGIALLAAVHAFPAQAVALSVVASAFLISAHFLNTRACRRACAACPVHHAHDR